MLHKPVLLKEVLQYLDPKPGENFIDATVGQGGHAKEILQKIKPSGKVLGIDADPQQTENCRREITDARLLLVNNSYANIKNILAESRFAPVNGILADLGFSSWQMDEGGKGFSFLRDEPLDMRYSPRVNCHSRESGNPERVHEPLDSGPESSSGQAFTRQNDSITATDIVNTWPQEEIERILREFGEEKFAKNIARKIVENRKQNEIKTTFQLVEIIKSALPIKFQHGKIHFATRTFQALRIATNNELENLKKFLPETVDVLEKGGRLVVISFHSLEDRIVKNFFKEEEKNEKIKILTKKPVVSTIEEAQANPRARSAKLRAIVKI